MLLSRHARPLAGILLATLALSERAGAPAPAPPEMGLTVGDGINSTGVIEHSDNPADLSEYFGRANTPLGHHFALHFSVKVE